MTSANPSPPNQSHPDPQSQVLDCLARGGTVVTANARAARALERRYTIAQRAAGRSAWMTPPIYDWESWLGSLWKQHLLSAQSAPLLLSPLQERSVWKKSIGGDFGDSESISILASNAWRHLSDFAAHDERRRSWQTFATSDAESFRGWAGEFERECRRKDWMSRSDLPTLLTDSIREGQITLPKELMLVGFDRTTPAQQRLIEAANRSGSIVAMLEIPNTILAPEIVAAKDLRDELDTCAWWARRRIEADPASRIAVITQDLNGTRGEIDRTFRSVLMPHSMRIENQQPLPYEFSLGLPLAAIPIVKAALLLLRWLIAPLAQAEISWLMLSGFVLAGGEEAAPLASLDHEIREDAKLPPQTSLDDFLSYSPRRVEEESRQFLLRLRDFRRAAAIAGVEQRMRTFRDWLVFAETALRQTGWPGARTLESLEFQALTRWNRLSEEIEALGFDGAQVGYEAFVTALERYATETIFSPESGHAPIQIMGALEAAGQQFDELWFLGADDSKWPAAAQPHPLLPLSVQRDFGMPHASIDADWQLALAVTQRIASSAGNSILSYAERDDSGELRQSPLLTEVFGHALHTTTSQQLRARMAVPTTPEHRCETVLVEDASAIPWPRDVSAGGSEILKRQSACGFQAFAARRLGAKELKNAERGLTALDRGNILHDVLQALWSSDSATEWTLHTREDLKSAHAGGRLSAILSHHIQDVFAERRGSSRESVWTKRYLQVEQARLTSLLLRWLDYEAAREPFTVAQVEQRRSASINDLQLNLRVDRVDRVADGHLILDYKTGRVSTAMWSGDRPEEPQLPLYGVFGGVDDLRGVLFAQIQAGEVGFSGHAENVTETVTNNPELAKRLAKNPLDDEILGAWSDALSNLADQFLQGNADVAPKSYPKTCAYCELAPLCRVAETRAVLDGEDEEESAGDGDDGDENIARGGDE